MRRQRGHKARLFLTPAQALAAEGQGHAARAMWNLVHDWWTMLPKERRNLAAADAAIRQGRKDLPWRGVLPAQAAQAVLKTYFQAWKNCWDGRADAPNFKGRFRSRMAIDIPQGRDLQIVRLNRRWGRMWAPKIGHVLFRWTKDLPVGKHADKENRVTGARLVKEADGWHVVFRVQSEVPEPAPHTGPTVGIDRGITRPLALSDGTFRDHAPWLTSAEAERLRRLEKTRERKCRARKPGEPNSRRLTRTYDQIAQLRATAKRRAVDWQHKTTTEISRTFSRIGVEDLAITNMVKSAKGSVEQPGRNVRQKAGLNRAIAGEAWGRTVTMLEYKTADRGGSVVKVPAPNTSRRCSACGFVTSGSRETQARFVCKADGCGFEANADTNAGRNIDHAAGQAVSGRGDFGVTRSKKRQPLTQPHVA
ncbi:DNA-cytosine-5-methyltransferase [Streptomyces bingchenggensis BCW-1]|uniref:DNA-cytosine-5-methyltransferase n=1 Tax=Streptomyces bingchenggensis (strain BCW-1) TaxID=749414 RepID=D7C965_STRBB|nr:MULTISPECIES: RNA-guided endonuclease TnpB family protein [Streptomyces]ADI10583.1 DNA-cytosine-5-methyltransferase [Streptomyces bingchenggensis BCW-1]